MGKGAAESVRHIKSSDDEGEPRMCILKLLCLSGKGRGQVSMALTATLEPLLTAHLTSPSWPFVWEDTSIPSESPDLYRDISHYQASMAP